MTYDLSAAKAAEMARAATAHLDHCLFRALRRHLDKSDLLLSDVFTMRERLACVEQNGSTWFYVDGQCFYGIGPLQIEANEGHDAAYITLMASRQELDTKDAPGLPSPVLFG